MTSRNILRSSFKFVKETTFKYEGISQYLLEKANENVKSGRTNWMTNSISGETTYFGDVEPHSRKIASFFTKRGLRKGDICIYLTTDVTRIFKIIVGIWRAGRCVAASYPEDTHDTLGDRAREYKAKWILCDTSSISQCQAATKDLDHSVEIFAFGSRDAAVAAGATSVDEIFDDDGSSCPKDVKYNLDDPALILCTSGTTGRSKGLSFLMR